MKQSSIIVLAALIVATLCLILGIYMTKEETFFDMRKSYFYDKQEEPFMMMNYGKKEPFMHYGKKESFIRAPSSLDIVPPPEPRVEIVPPVYSQNRALVDAPREAEVKPYSDAIDRVTGPYVPGPGPAAGSSYNVSVPIPCDPFSNATCFTRV
jgi:hypothetical protein